MSKKLYAEIRTCLRPEAKICNIVFFKVCMFLKL